MITESDQIANALDDAAQRWPADRGNRSKSLLRLRAEGHRTLLDQRAQDVVIRRDAVCRTSGGAATALKFPDCCVLLAGDEVADAVATFDDRLAAAARSRGLTVWGD